MDQRLAAAEQPLLLHVCPVHPDLQHGKASAHLPAVCQEWVVRASPGLWTEMLQTL